MYMAYREPPSPMRWALLLLLLLIMRTPKSREIQYLSHSDQAGSVEPGLPTSVLTTSRTKLKTSLWRSVYLTPSFLWAQKSEPLASRE